MLAASTRERLRGHRVVQLKVGLADGIRRTGMSTARPLLAGVNPRATFKALLDARAPLYREVATVEVDTVTAQREPGRARRAGGRAGPSRPPRRRGGAGRDGGDPPHGTPRPGPTGIRRSTPSTCPRPVAGVPLPHPFVRQHP